MDFLENVPRFENANNIKFQRIHRLGKPKNDNGDGGRTIIARFLRFSDRERVFKLGRKLKGTKFQDVRRHSKRVTSKEKITDGKTEGGKERR